MTTIIIKNSTTANKRPAVGDLEAGELALNINSASPGLFFKNDEDKLIKAGPVAFGTTPPNSNPAGAAGNCVGELWCDTTSSPNYLPMKVWDGAQWANCFTEPTLPGVTTNTLTAFGVGANQTAKNAILVGNDVGRQFTAATENVVGVGYEVAYTAAGVAASNSVALGYQAARNPATIANSVAIGYQAGYQASTLSKCVAMGAQALSVNESEGSTGIGYNALKKNTTGVNTAFGWGAMAQNTTGTGNVAVGHSAGSELIAGNYNTLIGHQSGAFLKNGSNNVHIGYACGSDGSSNIVIGNNTARANQGDGNIIIGHQSVSTVQRMDYNVILGPISDTSGIEGTSNQFIIASASKNIYLRFNENGAMAPGKSQTLPTNFGNVNAPLVSKGKDAPPVWGTPGVSGTFKTNDGKTVTVTDGLVTSVQ